MEAFKMKVCDECNSVCRALIVTCKPDSSEWYCQKCDKSFPMTEREVKIMQVNHGKIN